jgi:hypothetical protein
MFGGLVMANVEKFEFEGLPFLFTFEADDEETSWTVIPGNLAAEGSMDDDGFYDRLHAYAGRMFI